MHPMTRLAARLFLTVAGLPFAASAAPSIIALPDAAVTPVRRAVSIAVLANDTGADAEICVTSVARPSNGRAQITGNGKRIRYTPNEGFTGLDRFTYVTETQTGARASAEVTVAVGDGNTLRLRGNVVGARRGKARVHALVNGYEFATQSNVHGRYTLDVATLDGSGFVNLHADATGAGGIALDFSATVGEFGRLVKEAGTDTTLRAPENHQVNVSPLSTALAILLARTSGDSVPTTDLALRRALQSLNADELLELTAVISLLASGEAPLPTNVFSILELIESPEQLAAFKASLSPGQLAGALDAIDGHPGLLPDFDPLHLNSAYALAEPGAPDTVRVGRTVGRLAVVLTEFAGAGAGADAGAGRAIARIPNPDPSTGWQLDAGQVSIAFVTPQPITRFELTQTCPSFPQRPVIRSILGHRLQRIVDGPGFDHVALVTTTLVEFPDMPNLGCQPLPSTTVVTRANFLAFETGGDRLGELPYSAPSGEYGLALYAAGPAPLDPWEYELYDFGAIASSAATWWVDDGHLFVQQPRGGLTEYMRLLNDGSKGDGVLALATLPDGSQSVEYFLGVARDGSLEFTESNLTTLWRSGTFISRLPGTPSEPETLMRFDAGGAGIEHNVDASGACGLASAMTWSLADGELVATRPGVLRPLIVRWKPIASDGARIYVIEDRSLADRRIRGAFYDAVDESICAGAP